MLTWSDIEILYDDYCYECEQLGIEPIADINEWWESLE